MRRKSHLELARIWLANIAARMKSVIVIFLVLLPSLWLAPELRAQTNANLVVAFVTTNSTPLNLFGLNLYSAK